jgi:hypothetical protein
VWLATQALPSLTSFFVLGVLHRLFLSIKILKPLKTVALQKMDLPSSSGKIAETPLLLDPVDRITTRHADIRGKRGYI